MCIYIYKYVCVDVIFGWHSTILPVFYENKKISAIKILHRNAIEVLRILAKYNHQVLVDMKIKEKEKFLNKNNGLNTIYTCR